MIDTLHAILTDTDARKSEAIEARLSENTSAGTAWFD